VSPNPRAFAACPVRALARRRRRVAAALRPTIDNAASVRAGRVAGVRGFGDTP